MTSYSPPAPSPTGRRAHRALVLVVVILGLAILLVLALIAVVVLRGTDTAGAPATATAPALVSSRSSAASSSSSPSVTASASSAPSSVAASTRTASVAASKTTLPLVRTFAVVPQSNINGATVICDKAENLLVDFVWSTSGATTVDFGVATLDASAAPYATNLPVNGSLGSGRAVVFQCYADTGLHTQFYTLTVLSPGQKVSRTITLKEKYVP